MYLHEFIFFQHIIETLKYIHQVFSLHKYIIYNKVLKLEKNNRKK